MELKQMIYKIRNNAKMSQEQFAALFDVSRQSVQKWETGVAMPELSKIIEISKYFNISIDELVLNNGRSSFQQSKSGIKIEPKYSNVHDWEFYPAYAMAEYQQSVDEGLDVESYKEVFTAVANLPKDEIKKEFGDVLFKIVTNANQKEGYQYIEPSDLEGIKSLRGKKHRLSSVDEKELKDRIHGAWMGRICGCMLGKTVEGIKSEELEAFLKESDNYHMRRYIYKTDVSDETMNKYKYNFAIRDYADQIVGMPSDDDTNYVVLAQIIIDKYGKDFTPYDVSQVWLEYQPKSAYCTAERVAFRNFVNGYAPPQSAMYKNPFREWIGAQIRGDYFGYINPGNPEKAAEMAWRDASISHIKNGIYGEMYVAAMIAAAAVTDNIEDIVLCGLAEIPETSRLYEDVMSVMSDYKKGVSQKECFNKIHCKYDEHTEHGWCHTISNAMVVTAAMLYGGGSFDKSICAAVETGFDTDCNGATVGSILGMAKGITSISEDWTGPMHDTLHTTIFGVGSVKISDRVELTMQHIKKD